MKKQIDIDLDVSRKIEAARESFKESENAILRRLLRIDPRNTETPAPRPRLPRSSGAYSIVLSEQTIEANSLKELLRRTILAAEKMRRGTVDELARNPTSRGRFVVARTPAGLYPRSPQLQEYAEKLDGEWWYDGNVSRNQVGGYLKTIARMLALSSIPTIIKRSEKTSMPFSAEDLAP